MAHLDIQSLSIHYTMKRTLQELVAVEDVRFAVEAGELVAIVGPSGCGKTSILGAIAGIVPVHRGTIVLDGRRVEGPGRDRAMVFQAPALLPWRTVLRNVTYGLELQGVKGPVARAQQYIDLVGLRGFEESYPHELSGGMQQRVNLARALAVEPKLLLFDEPLSALDAQTHQRMLLELQRILMQARTTTVYITHNIGEALFLADRVVVMTSRPGRIRETLRVDAPKPRPPAARRDPQFLELEDRIWSLLEDDEPDDRMTR